MSAEARIGSLPWFAGVWWLGVSCALHYLARGAARVGWVKAAWVLVGWTTRATAAALACAREAGAEE